MSFGKSDIAKNINIKAHINLNTSQLILNSFINHIKNSQNKTIKISSLDLFLYEIHLKKLVETLKLWTNL